MAKENKTIGITLRFFTNDLPARVGGDDKQIPMWSIGTALMEANKGKELKSDSEHFFSISDIERAVNILLARAKIVTVNDVAYTQRAKKRLK